MRVGDRIETESETEYESAGVKLSETESAGSEVRDFEKVSDRLSVRENDAEGSALLDALSEVDSDSVIVIDFDMESVKEEEMVQVAAGDTDHVSVLAERDFVGGGDRVGVPCVSSAVMDFESVSVAT